MSERSRVRALRIAGVGALLVGWEAVVRAGGVDPLFVPAPTAVARALGEVGGPALAALGDTLFKTAVAYAIAAGLGIGAGVVIGAVPRLHQALNPFVIALYGIPKILILPWIVLWLGFGTVPAVAYGALHGVFPILVLVMGAVRDVDPHLLTVARAYGARPWQVHAKVILPAIVPSVVASLRLGIVFCLLGVLVVEMFAGIRGMGHVLGSLANGFRAPELFAATALVSAASIAIVLALDRVQERLSRWRGAP
ncbi:MAG TPA: ABC transporter permease [Candidatus Binatia bacterium]|nr:ABC transporter permease [Candidatus Binatia bacterium]